MKERKHYIDIYKGIAILFVMIGHISIQMYGLNNYSNDKYLYLIYLLIYLFHMPFFFAISGYLEKEYKTNNFKKTFFKYFFSLVIPYILFSYLLITINIILHNKNFSLLNYLTIIYKPVSNLWFIYALFYIKMIEIIMYKFINNEKIITFIWGLIFLLSFTIIDDKTVVGNIVNFGVAFHLGILINKKEDINNFIFLLLLIIIGTFIYFNYNYLIGKTIVGVSLFYVLNYLGRKINLKNKFLEYLGKNTMIIFIIDGFTGLPLINIIQLSHIKYSFIIMALCIISKIIISVVVIKMSENIKLIKYIFYPYLIKKAKKP